MTDHINQPTARRTHHRRVAAGLAATAALLAVLAGCGSDTSRSTESSATMATDEPSISVLTTTVTSTLSETTPPAVYGPALPSSGTATSTDDTSASEPSPGAAGYSTEAVPVSFDGWDYTFTLDASKLVVRLAKQIEFSPPGEARLVIYLTRSSHKLLDPATPGRTPPEYSTNASIVVPVTVDVPLSSFRWGDLYYNTSLDNDGNIIIPSVDEYRYTEEIPCELRQTSVATYVWCYHQMGYDLESATWMSGDVPEETVDAVIAAMTPRLTTPDVRVFFKTACVLYYQYGGGVYWWDHNTGAAC